MSAARRRSLRRTQGKEIDLGIKFYYIGSGYLNGNVEQHRNELTRPDIESFAFSRVDTHAVVFVSIRRNGWTMDTSG